MFTISRRPYRLSSRPMPLCLMPPKGIRGSDFTTPLTNTIPESICRTRPFADRVLHLTLDLLPLGLVDQGSNVRRGTKGIPDTERPDLLHEPRGELLGDGVDDEEPLRGDARLSRVHEAAGDCPFRRGVEVRVVRDDERIRPPEF